MQVQISRAEIVALANASSHMTNSIAQLADIGTSRRHVGSVPIVCKSRKLQGNEFFAKTRNGKQSPIRIDAIALSKSTVSLTLGDEVPHIFTRKPRLRLLEFLILGAKTTFATQSEMKRT